MDGQSDELEDRQGQGIWLPFITATILPIIQLSLLWLSPRKATSDFKTEGLHGAGSVCRGCDSWSWSCESEPHTEHRNCLIKKKKDKTVVFLLTKGCIHTRDIPLHLESRRHSKLTHLAFWVHIWWFFCNTTLLSLFHKDTGYVDKTGFQESLSP